MWNISQKILDTNDDENFLNSVLSQLKTPQRFLTKVQELYKSNEHDLDALEFNDGKVFERYSEPLIVNEKIVGRVWSFRDTSERDKAEKEKI